MKDYSSIGRLGACLVLKNNNYGSMLQSFATQKVLDDYKIEYHLLEYKKKYTPLFVIKSVPRVLNAVVWQDKYHENKKKRFLKKHPEIMKEVMKRKEAFDNFRKFYFKAPIVTFCGYDELQEKSCNYTTFLSGSDQLWSPSGLPTNFYNLMFTYDNALRISYASSFGVRQIPWYQIRRTRNYLNRIQYVSCREESGSKIVEKLTGRAVTTVVDPTMLFTREEWEKLLPVERVCEGEYIFSYLLGTNCDYRDEIKKLSRDTGLPIVSIHQYVEVDLVFGDISIDDAGPAEFVDLIRNAKYVCTDSFHGSVFSILNHKKFIVFDRYVSNSKTSKNTRIDNLCNQLGLSDRRYCGKLYQQIIHEIDYEDVDARIEMLRKKSRQYLECAFESIKKET